MSRLPNNIFIRRALGQLGEQFCRAALVCCERQYGANRNQKGIVAVAIEYCIRPAELLALFGFLPRYSPGRGNYVDMLQTDNCEDIGLLPKNDKRAVMAFALSRAVCDNGLSLICE